jgi:hypothetical protein
LLVDVNSTEDVVEAINKIDDIDIVKELIKNGDKMITKNIDERLKAEDNLEKKILRFKKIKETWS